MTAHAKTLTASLFEEQAVANLSPATRRQYAALWRAHIHPRLGNGALREATPGAIQGLRAQLTREGVDSGSIDSTVTLLRTFLPEREGAGDRASLEELSVPRPGSGAAAASALEPEAVERIRAGLGRRGATLVSALAYAGLRPSEALSLRWRDVSERFLSVDGSSTDAGPQQHTRTGKRRTVRLLRPLAEDLREWRGVSSHPDAHDLVFPHRTQHYWSDADWRQWRTRKFARAVRNAGLPRELRPFDLRHTFALLLIRAGVSIVEIAPETGHGPLVTLSIYRDLLVRQEGTSPRPAGGGIIAARKSLDLVAAA